MILTQILLLCGVVAGPLFIFVFLIEGYLRRGYNPLRQPVSALSQGPRGWIQQTNFFFNGVLLVACSVGLYLVLAPIGAVWAPLLIFLYGAALLGAGVFVTDSGVAPANGKRTKAGVLHDLFSAVVFISLCIDCFVFATIFNGMDLSTWAIVSTIVGILYGVGFVIFARGFSPDSTLASMAGLLQRLTISLGAIWLSSVALYFLLG